MSASLYEAFDLAHDYAGRPGLRLAHLAIPSGAILGLAGPNGCGKSTLLKILAFLLTPSRGRLLYRGQTVTDPAAVRREVTLLLQEPYLLRRSVFDNVTFGLALRGDTDDLFGRAAAALDMVGLDPAKFARRRWFELSGGEAQRVALASRLILKPVALLLDEPTASLDATSTVRIQEAAVQARRAWGTTLVIVSHDHTWLAGVADEVLNLRPAEAAGAMELMT